MRARIEQANDARNDRRRDQRQVHGQETPAPGGRASLHAEPVIGKEDERKHRRGFFSGQRRDPERDGHNAHVLLDGVGRVLWDPPVSRSEDPAYQPAAPAHDREHEERRAQHFGPPADVADGLGHHRVHREQQRRRKGHQQPVLLEAPGELKQEHDVQHVQQHIGHMETERRRRPRRRGRARRRN